MRLFRALFCGFVLVALLLVPPFKPRAHGDAGATGEAVALHQHDQNSHHHDHDEDDAAGQPAHTHHGADHIHDIGVLPKLRLAQARAARVIALPLPDERASRGLIWPLERPPRAL